MLGAASLALGVVVAAVFVTWLIRRFRGSSSERRESRKRHRDAQRRDPPVDLGETVTAVVDDFSEHAEPRHRTADDPEHHSGERHAVCKVEGFVVFVEDVPRKLEEGDVIRLEVRSFNRGHTSASAAFLERA